MSRAEKNAEFLAFRAATITAFLEDAAEQGWHMRPDEATGEMNEAGSVACWADQAPRCNRQMLAVAPKFELEE